MQLKGLVRFFAIALTLICLYQLSFTWFVKNHESEMDKKATAWLKTYPSPETKYPGNKELQSAYADSDLARDVLTRRAFRIGATHDDVLDLSRIEFRALERRLDGVAAHGRAMGHVERALPALAERRTRGGNDHCVSHLVPPEN